MIMSIFKNMKIYRYRAFNNWDAARILSELEDIRNDRVALIKPSMFNDPYDCYLPIDEKKLLEDFKTVFYKQVEDYVENNKYLNERERGIIENILNDDIKKTFL